MVSSHSQESVGRPVGWYDRRMVRITELNISTIPFPEGWLMQITYKEAVVALSLTACVVVDP